jgi:hypothetical protein
VFDHAHAHDHDHDQPGRPQVALDALTGRRNEVSRGQSPPVGVGVGVTVGEHSQNVKLAPTPTLQSSTD